MSTEEREDHLTEDVPIPGQNFCLLSFLSPEKVLANKDIYFFEKFVANFEFNFRINSFEKFLMTTLKSVNDKLNSEADAAEAKDLSGVAQTLRDSRLRMDTIMDTFKTYTKSAQEDLKASKLKELFEDFVHSNRAVLENEFYTINEFRTTVRGLKIRGAYSSKEEAVARSKKLQRLDPIHNIFVAEVGKWLPWDPEPSQVGEQEYAEEKLNTLMKKYKENEEAKEMFERENRAQMLNAGKKNKAKIGITKEDGKVDEITEAETAIIGEIATKAEEYEGIFSQSGHPDLAIARKIENASM
jgi:Family of unknown function (DUF5832)